MRTLMTDTRPRRLEPPPAPNAGVSQVVAWVSTHLADLVGPGPFTPSRRFRGGDQAAKAALADTNLAGYAHTRSLVDPVNRRGATALSPYVRHGMLPLPLLWRFARDAPFEDKQKFRDELLWQEYARHLYARLGTKTAPPLRYVNRQATTPTNTVDFTGETATQMACLDAARSELATDGFLVNQQRLWVASHFSVRHGYNPAIGEGLLYRQLLDGSRAANRLGWQWTAGTGTGRPYAFTRRQVERYAPAFCASCPLAANCPIETAPDEPVFMPVDADSRLRHDPDPDATGGPQRRVARDPLRSPQAVWLTAESLSEHDPALTHHPDLPAIFVFDAPLLARLGLAPKRLIFLAESLGDLATHRDLQVWRGDVREVLTSHTGNDSEPLALAGTFTPVPGWQKRAQPLVELHPWHWLRRPHSGPATSFTAWRNHGEKR